MKKQTEQQLLDKIAELERRIFQLELRPIIFNMPQIVPIPSYPIYPSNPYLYNPPYHFTSCKTQPDSACAQTLSKS